jgi:hypothetical protein
VRIEGFGGVWSGAQSEPRKVDSIFPLAQTRRLIRSRMRTTLPGNPSCHQVQAGACRFADGWMHKVSNELSAIWAARFTNTSSSYVVCSDSRTPHTRRFSCLRNLRRVSSYFSAGYERLRWLLDFRIIHSVQVQVSSSLTSSSDYNATGDESVYINVALIILRSSICLINTTTDPRPNFSSLHLPTQYR